MIDKKDDEIKVETETEFYNGCEDITLEEMQKRKDIKILPTFTSKQLSKYIKDIDDDRLKKDKIPVRQLDFITKSFGEKITPNDIGYLENYNTTKHVVNHNEVDMKLKPLDFNRRAKSSNSALMKLSKKLSIGSHVHIPLWNSGFWITLKPFDNMELINLELELTDEFDRIGKDTNTLIYSNHEALFIEVMVKHIRPKILESTLQIENDDDYFNYISLKDMPVITIALATSIYPKGVNMVFPCKNTSEVDKSTNKPKCSHLITKHIDIEQLHRVDCSKLSIKQLDLMAKKKPRSSAIEAILAYQDEINENLDDTFLINSYDNEDTKITISFPMINDYITSGEIFINELRDMTNEIIESNTSIKDKEIAENMIITAIHAQTFNSFIKTITIDDAVISEIEEIDEALRLFSSDETQSKTIIDNINNFINKSLISYIGIPNYICPSCKEKQHDKEIIPIELIPISVYSYFFTLLHSKYKKILKQLEQRQAN